MNRIPGSTSISTDETSSDGKASIWVTGECSPSTWEASPDSGNPQGSPEGEAPLGCREWLELESPRIGSSSLGAEFTSGGMSEDAEDERSKSNTCSVLDEVSDKGGRKGLSSVLGTCSSVSE